jgi:hypothetical protein
MEGIGSIENPIVVSSIRSEIAFLSNLVTLEGDYILYHRLGSTHFGKRILDHYEAIDCSGNRFEDTRVNHWEKWFLTKAELREEKLKELGI